MRTEIRQKIDEIQRNLKKGLVWLVSGAVLATAIGFTWGGWATASTIQKMSEEAVLMSRAEICASQFLMDALQKDNVKQFQEMENWKRYEFVENGGWDKMPGQEKASHSVSRACVGTIEARIKK